jgi:alkylation response protein AidB-like acyl-CoA dehydrogenase
MSVHLTDNAVRTDASVLGLLQSIAASAGDVDANVDADRREVLGQLAAAGLLDLGLAIGQGSYLDQARVLADVASMCMSTAFSAWAHRMTLEYVATYGADKHGHIVDALQSLEMVGSTAMAGTFRAASGQEELTVHITEDDNGILRANGFIPWASNLYDNAVIVTGMLHGNSRRIVVLNRLREGIEVLPTPQLMALDASRSGAIRLVNVVVTADDIIDVDFLEFVRSVRPTFLAFQSAFCIGLASASLGAIRELRGVAQSLSERVSSQRDELARLCHRLEALTIWLGNREGGVPLNPVRLRLEAGHLAVSATQLELAVCGGRSFEAASETSRRVREGLFIPVQSPTEAQLQWELQQSK